MSRRVDDDSIRNVSAATSTCADVGSASRSSASAAPSSRSLCHPVMCVSPPSLPCPCL